jgi:hypothetical protein
MQLRLYHRRFEYIEGRKLKVVADPELFSGDVGRSVLADYQYNRAEVRFLAKRRFERDLTTIRIQPGDWKPSPRDIEKMVAKRADDMYKDHGSPVGDFGKTQAEARREITERLSAGDFFAASPEILIELSPSWVSVTTAAVLLALGTILLSLPPDSVKWALHVTGVPEQSLAAWSVFIRSLAGLFAFFGIIYVFRKWPLK